tara:strand:+ start:129 stop:593 length:465 start_codon:yes stop_codon:yes gene_type:complete
MKYLLFTIALFLCVHITAQKLPKKSKIFVRVYNNEGEKIAKGKILNITDDALILKKGSSSITVATADIMYIKTKRTNGHNMLIGGLAGGGYALYGASQSGDWGVVAAVILTPIFTAIGGGIGYLTTIFKNSVHYSIQGDPIKWQGFKEAMFAPE